MSDGKRVAVVDVLDKLDIVLAKGLMGKTLLGEIVLGEQQCNEIASALHGVARHFGAATALTMAIERWRLVLAVWLVNEAFFSFVSGAFWPNVLGKLNVADIGNQSVKLGRAFVALLERRGLPRFRRLNTRWSYLGPLLAHAGIPRSCLPEFFDKVLPRAAEYGVDDSEGYQDLLHDLPRLYLTKPTERFLLFGEDVALDFVRRCVELRSIWLSQGAVPNAGVVRLPPRVVEAFKSWSEQAHRVTASHSGRRQLRRPALVLDPGQGVLLLLPAQRVSLGSQLVWQIEPNVGEAVRVEAPREPGADETLAAELVLGEPFSALKVQLRSGSESLGMWAFNGASQEAPFMFFDAEGFRILGQRAPAAGELGVVHQTGWTVRTGEEAAPRVVADLGQLPLGWADLTARVYDLSEAAELLLLDESGNEVRSVELAEEATRPRLVPHVVGDQPVFHGGAPSLELCRSIHDSEEEFLKAWRVEIAAGPDCDGHVDTFSRPLGTLAWTRRDGSRWYSIDLAQDELLGASSWGEFELRAKGPLGKDSLFRFLILPAVQTGYSAAEWLANPRQLRVQVQVPEKIGVRGATPTADPCIFEIITQGEAVRVYLDAAAFRGRRCELPFDVAVPIPSWAIYDPQAGAPLLAWSRDPVRVSLREVEGRPAVLLAKLALPWGVPKRVDLALRAGATEILTQEVRPDGRGFARIDLAAAMAAARQTRMLRVDVALVLDGLELVCAHLQRHWAPADFTARVEGESATFTWSEGVTVDHRAIELVSLFAPWEPSRRLAVPDDVRGEWRAPLESIAPTPGRYHCALGIEDVWSDRFEAGDGEGAILDRGTIDNWATTALFRDPGPDGYLYRLLLHHHTGAIGLPDEPGLDSADQAELAGKLLRTELSLRSSQSDLLRARVSRLLYRLPGHALLGGIAAMPEQCEPSLVLRAQLLNRPIRNVRGGTTPEKLTELNVDALWKAWAPLGLWSDLHLMRATPGNSEERLVRHLGREALLVLCPAQVDGQLVVWVDGHERLDCRITEILSAKPLSPFEVTRLESSVSLKIAIPSDASNAAAIITRDQHARWAVQSVDDARLPDSLAALNGAGHDTAKVRCFYPHTNRQPLHPEGQMVALIKRGSTAAMEAIRAEVSALPVSPIGSIAFQNACFDWALCAARDRPIRERLEELCATIALPAATTVIEEARKATSAGEWWAKDELGRRWVPNAYQEPLFAVHFLVWLVAMTLFWRGLGRTTPLRLNDDTLTDTALALHEIAPKLLEHDLLKLGALEVLETARTLRHDA